MLGFFSISFRNHSLKTLLFLLYDAVPLMSLRPHMYPSNNTDDCIIVIGLPLYSSLVSNHWASSPLNSEGYCDDQMSFVNHLAYKSYACIFSF